MLGGGAKDKVHAMSQKLKSAIAVTDIGKSSFHIVGLPAMAQRSCFLTNNSPNKKIDWTRLSSGI
jgi:hypothetical protein